MQTISVISFMLCVFVLNTAAQEAIHSRESVRTRMEAFQAKAGVVIVENYSDIGGIEGYLGTSIALQAIELSESNSQKREYGIEVQVRGQNSENARSYVDYDEIEPLLKALDFMANAKSKTTESKSFRAAYRTKGGFAVSTYSDSTGKRLYIASGRTVSVSATFDTDKLIEVRTLFVIASSALDRMRKKM